MKSLSQYITSVSESVISNSNIVTKFLDEQLAEADLSDVIALCNGLCEKFSWNEDIVYENNDETIEELFGSREAFDEKIEDSDTYNGREEYFIIDTYGKIVSMNSEDTFEHCVSVIEDLLSEGLTDSNTITSIRTNFETIAASLEDYKDYPGISDIADNALYLVDVIDGFEDHGQTITIDELSDTIEKL